METRLLVHLRAWLHNNFAPDSFCNTSTVLDIVGERERANVGIYINLYCSGCTSVLLSK